MSTAKSTITKRERELGRRARQRALDRAGSARISDSAWLPEVEHLLSLGLTGPQIAKALQLSERRVREIKQFGTNSKGVVFVPDFKSKDELPADVQECLEFTADGFEKFYERFSGRTLPAHCKDWVHQFCTNRNLMLNVPPRHMKSSIFSLWVPVWLICRDRNERILLVSLTKESSKKWVSGIAEQLTLNEDIVETFGRFAPNRSGEHAWRPLSGTLMVSGRGKTTGVQYSVESRGSGQQILGMEATVVIVDDVTDGAIANNERERVKQLEWLRTEVLSRVETQSTESSGRAIIVGQRLSVHDIYGMLANQKYERGPKQGDRLWTVITRPAILRWPDEDPEHPEPQVLWPEKWTFDELMLTYERVGGHNAFTAMYQQQPIAEGEDTFRPEWWPRCRDLERKGGMGMERGFLPVSRVFSIDPSVKEYHGLVVADVVFDRGRFLCQVLEAKRWKGPQRSIIAEIERVLHTYRPEYFIFEDVSFIQWLKEDPFYQDIVRRVRVVPHQTGRNKGDPDMGVESLAREVEFGRIRLPYADEWGRQISTLIEEEANAFPYGTTSDVLMALWFIKWNWRKLRPRDAQAGKLKWIPDALGVSAWAGFDRRSA